MEYKTNIIAMAAYLYLQKDLSFVGIDKTNPLEMQFKFTPADKASEYAEKYLSGKARVNPLKFYQNFKLLRNMVFEARKYIQQQNRKYYIDEYRQE